MPRGGSPEPPRFRILAASTRSIGIPRRTFAGTRRGAGDETADNELLLGTGRPHSLGQVRDHRVVTVREPAGKSLVDGGRSLEFSPEGATPFRLIAGSMTTIFEKTIVYLLETHGALATVEIHPMIARIHSDLCDDSIDRVIDGRRYGKKWKHAVRSAQSHLKADGKIALAHEKWRLTSDT
ncbi:MAG: hypothetical protein WD066_15450 [Planctomycetaceae bacterium]